MTMLTNWPKGLQYERNSSSRFNIIQEKGSVSIRLPYIKAMIPRQSANEIFGGSICDLIKNISKCNDELCMDIITLNGEQFKMNVLLESIDMTSALFYSMISKSAVIDIDPLMNYYILNKVNITTIRAHARQSMSQTLSGKNNLANNVLRSSFYDFVNLEADGNRDRVANRLIRLMLDKPLIQDKVGKILYTNLNTVAPAELSLKFSGHKTDAAYNQMLLRCGLAFRNYMAAKTIFVMEDGSEYRMPFVGYEFYQLGVPIGSAATLSQPFNSPYVKRNGTPCLTLVKTSKNDPEVTPWQGINFLASMNDECEYSIIPLNSVMPKNFYDLYYGPSATHDNPLDLRNAFDRFVRELAINQTEAYMKILEHSK